MYEVVVVIGDGRKWDGSHPSIDLISYFIELYLWELHVIKDK